MLHVSRGGREKKERRAAMMMLEKQVKCQLRCA